MSDDLVGRLRREQQSWEDNFGADGDYVFGPAADRIEAHSADLRSALAAIARLRVSRQTLLAENASLRVSRQTLLDAGECRRAEAHAAQLDWDRLVAESNRHRGGA